MNNKILVTVVVPMLEETYDIYIPVSKSINVTIDLLVNTINELSEGHFPLDKKHVFMSDKGVVFDKNCNVKECNIKNGDSVILI